MDVLLRIAPDIGQQQFQIGCQPGQVVVKFVIVK